MLEYCEGGDLGAYIHRHGRVSEDVARHFIKHLGIIFYIIFCLFIYIFIY